MTINSVEAEERWKVCSHVTDNGDTCSCKSKWTKNSKE